MYIYIYVCMCVCALLFQKVKDYIKNTLQIVVVCIINLIDCVHQLIQM